MATVTNDIVTRFAFEGNINPLSDFNMQMAGSIKFMAAFVAGLAATGLAITKWTNDISGANDAMGQLSRNIGVSVESLGELGYAASQSGSGIDAISSSLSSLNQKIGEATIQGNEDFARLGISIFDAAGRVKSADRVFLDFSARVKQLGFNQQQTADFASRLGIDESLVQLLMKSSDEINTLRQRAVELGRVTTEQSDRMLAYNDTLSTLGYAYENLKVQIAVGLIPQLQELAQGMTTWLVDSAQSIVEAFKKIVNFLIILGDSLRKTAPVVFTIAGAFIAWKIATNGVRYALLALNRIPIIALLTGLYLIADDIATAFEDGDSVIGDFYSTLTGGRSIVDDLTSAWNSVFDGFNMWYEKLKEIWGILSDIGQSIVNFGSGGIDLFQGMMGSSTSSSNAVVNNNTNIDIRTNDPVRAGDEVNNALSRQTEDALLQSGILSR